MAIDTYTVVAQLPDGSEVQLPAYNGTAGRDWAGIVTERLKTYYAQQLIEMGYTQEAAASATFSAKASK